MMPPLDPRIGYPHGMANGDLQPEFTDNRNDLI
jgi:hypothetical protein